MSSEITDVVQIIHIVFEGADPLPARHWKMYEALRAAYEAYHGHPCKGEDGRENFYEEPFKARRGYARFQVP